MTMRMDAYYYSFTPTGVDAVDRVLSAVACAGKAYHHTEDWNVSANPPEYLRGEDPIEWIQNAAYAAAALQKEMLEALIDCAEALAAARDKLGMCGEGDGKDRKADAEDTIGSLPALTAARAAIAKAEGKS